MIFAEARDRLGDQLRSWLLRTAQTHPGRMQELLAVHHLGMRAMAVQDEAMLDLVARFLPFESTVGTASLDDLLADHPTLHYCDNDGDYRQVSQIAGAQRLAVINAGHAYDVEILQRLQSARAESRTARLDPQDLIGYLAEPAPADRELFGTVLDQAGAMLARTDVRTELRSFRPETVAVLLLASRKDAVRAVEDDLAEQADGAWAAVLSGLQRDLPNHPRFVINTDHPDLRRLAGSSDTELITLALRALYAHALASGRHRLTPFDATVLQQALPDLLRTTLDLQELR